MGKSSKIVVGYKYYLGLHLVLGYPGLTLKKLFVDGREAWSGSASSGQISVSAPNLFGGKSREGGVSGTIDVLDGNASQSKNSYLQSLLGSVIPAYRGVFSLVLRRFYIGNNPYLKNMAWEVQRTDVLTDGSVQWYQAKANINDGDLNAAHIIRECWTNAEWGLGYSNTDDAQFTAAADTLYTEGFGLTLVWSQPDSIEQFIQQVLDHINGVLREDPATGDVGLVLIRDDYVVANLPLFDASNVLSLDSFERRGWGETINEVTVTYHDRATDKDTPVTVQDIGNVQIQGAVINQTRAYPGISNAALASRVAARDLLAASSPLSKIEITVNREGYALRRADVFKFSWPELGLSEVVYRIVGIDAGETTDSKIRVTAVEDVWGLPSSTYMAPQVNGWVIPNNPPEAAAYERVMEASFWDVQNNVSQADIAQLDPDFGFVLAQAVKPTGDSYSYQMVCRNGTAPYEEQATGPFCPTAQLDGAIGPSTGGLTSAVISIKNPVDLDDVEVDTFAYIGNEAVAILAVDTSGLTITVDRGVLDTVPVPHSDDERVWFAETNQAFDETERVDAEEVDVKVLTTTGLGTLDEGDAAELTLILDNRYQRPYPPGNLKENSVAYAQYISGALALSWAHRDRTQQTAYLNDQEEGNIGPEAGVTYNLRLYGESDTLLRTETGLSGASYTWSDELEDSALTILLAPREVTSQSAFEAVVTPLSPEGWWRLGEPSGATTVDSSGNGHNGSYSGSYTLGQASLIPLDLVDTSTLFSGGHATIPSGAWIPQGAAARTLGVFFKTSTGGGYYGICGYGSPATRQAFNIRQDPIANRLVVFVWDDDMIIDLGTAVADGQPHSMFVVYDGATSLDVYWDGVWKAQRTLGASLNTAQTDIYIGRTIVGADPTFQGTIDDVLLFPSALTAQNIADLTASADPSTYRYNGSLRFELEAERGGLVSRQMHNHSMTRVGYGLNYGTYYGGL